MPQTDFNGRAVETLEAFAELPVAQVDGLPGVIKEANKKNVRDAHLDGILALLVDSGAILIEETPVTEEMREAGIGYRLYMRLTVVFPSGVKSPLDVKEAA